MSLLYSMSLDLSYSMSWEWNNFDDTILVSICGWWLLPSTYDVIYFTWISFETKSSTNGEINISLGLFIPLFIKIVWLLLMHILSPEIAIEVITQFL